MTIRGAQNISFTSELIPELSERGGGGRPGFPSLIVRTVSVDVKQR